MYKEEEMKKFLYKKCVSMLKCVAIQKLQIRFKLTREEAIKAYDEWRKEYLRGQEV